MDTARQPAGTRRSPRAPSICFLTSPGGSLADGLDLRVFVQGALIVVGGGLRSNTTFFTVPVKAQGALSS